MALGSTQSLTEMSTRNLPGSINLGHWIYIEDSMALVKVPHYTSRVIWEAIEINLHHDFSGLNA
jgi:hypothetical protein